MRPPTESEEKLDRVADFYEKWIAALESEGHSAELVRSARDGHLSRLRYAALPVVNGNGSNGAS